MPSHILKIVIRWEWSASRPGHFTLREKDPDTHRLGGPQSQTGRGGEEKNTQPVQGVESPIIQSVVQCCTAEISRLINVTSANNFPARRVL
jgi:hypothetical protein